MAYKQIGFVVNPTSLLALVNLSILLVNSFFILVRDSSFWYSFSLYFVRLPFSCKKFLICTDKSSTKTFWNSTSTCRNTLFICCKIELPSWKECCPKHRGLVSHFRALPWPLGTACWAPSVQRACVGSRGIDDYCDDRCGKVTFAMPSRIGYAEVCRPSVRKVKQKYFEILVLKVSPLSSLNEFGPIYCCRWSPTD